MVGSGCPVGPKGPKYSAHAITDEHDRRGEDNVLPDAIGNEGFAFVLRPGGDTHAHRCFLRTRRPGIGHSLMPRRSTIHTCTPTPSSRMPGITKTCSAKKRDSVCPADDRSAVDQVHQVGADKRDAAHDGGADAQTPVGVLVEAQHLSGEGHAQGQQQQHHTDDPGQLARKLVRAEHEDLHHVDQHHRDHEVRAPAMHAHAGTSPGSRYGSGTAGCSTPHRPTAYTPAPAGCRSSPASSAARSPRCRRRTTSSRPCSAPGASSLPRWARPGRDGARTSYMFQLQCLLALASATPALLAVGALESGSTGYSGVLP